MLLQDKLILILTKIENINDLSPEKIKNINECVDDLYHIVTDDNEEKINEYINRKKIFNKFFPYMFLYKLYLDNSFVS